MRVYLDSNVLISLINHEFGKRFEFMEQAVEEFLIKCREEKIELVLSELFFREVSKITHYSKEEILKKFKRTNFTMITITGEDKKLAKKINIHHPDCLHVALAVRNNCNYLVTWNLKDFEKQKLIHVVNPRDFLQ